MDSKWMNFKLHDLMILLFFPAAKAQLMYSAPQKLVNCADLPAETTSTTTKSVTKTFVPIRPLPIDVLPIAIKQAPVALADAPLKAAAMA